MAKRLTRGSKLNFIGKTKDNIRVYKNTGYFVCIYMELEDYSGEVKVIKKNSNFPDVYDNGIKFNIEDHWHPAESIETAEKRVLKNIRIGYDTFNQILEFNFEHEGMDIELFLNRYTDVLDEFLEYHEKEELAEIIWRNR